MAEIDLPTAHFDAVLLVLSYHDIYYVPEDGSWPKIDGPKLLANVCQSMKPGAVLGIVDHVAAAGAPAEVGNTLHRIDPERIKTEIATANCFEFIDSNDSLRNAEDDLTQPMYAEGVRGKTDRVIFKFRKKAD